LQTVVSADTQRWDGAQCPLSTQSGR